MNWIQKISASNKKQINKADNIVHIIKTKKTKKSQQTLDDINQINLYNIQNNFYNLYDEIIENINDSLVNYVEMYYIPIYNNNKSSYDLYKFIEKYSKNYKDIVVKYNNINVSDDEPDEKDNIYISDNDFE